MFFSQANAVLAENSSTGLVEIVTKLTSALAATEAVVALNAFALTQKKSMSPGSIASKFFIVAQQNENAAAAAKAKK